MKNNSKIYFYSYLLMMSLLCFILQIFVFQKPDGVFGLLICLFFIYLIFGSIIKLCILSKKFKNAFLESIDLLFWLP